MGSRIEYGVGAREGMEAAEVIICAIGRADLTVARINPSRLSVSSLSLPNPPLLPVFYFGSISPRLFWYGLREFPSEKHLFCKATTR